MVILEVRGPLELSTKDLIEDNQLGAAEEWRLATGHLVEDYSEGPKVREGARRCLVEHLRCHVQGRSHKRIRSFCFLDVLEFRLRPCEEGSAVVFTVVEGFAVAVVNLIMIGKAGAAKRLEFKFMTLLVSILSTLAS